MMKCSCDVSMLWNAHLWYYCQHVSCGTGKMQHGDDLPSRRTHRATKAFSFDGGTVAHVTRSQAFFMIFPKVQYKASDQSPGYEARVKPDWCKS